MSTSRIIKVFAALLLIGSGCAAHKQTPTLSGDECSMIHSGKLNYLNIPTEDASANSAYFDCAIGVRIGELELTANPESRIDPTKMADHFLSNLDPEYRDVYGNNILSILVISFTPLDWKLATAQKLIEMGVNIHAKNQFGKTALDLAESGEEPEVASLLRALAEQQKSAVR